MTPIQISRLAGFGKKPPQVFAQSPVVLGTAVGCGVRFDPTWDKGVAAQHVRIEWMGGQWALCDLGSSGGTWIGGRQVKGMVPIAEPIEFELGKNGPRCRVELVTETAAQAAPSFAAVAFPEAPPVPVPTYAPASTPTRMSGRKPSSGLAGPLIGIGVGIVLLIAAVVGWYLLEESYTVTPQPTASADKLAPLPPRIDDHSGGNQPAQPGGGQPSQPSGTEPAGPHLVEVPVSTTHSRGLLAPDDKQMDWIRKTLPTVQGVKLNSIARNRLMSNGTYATAPAAVDVGSELVTQTGETAGSGNTFNLQAADSTPLPEAVDNSQLPYFPGVGDQGQLGSCASFSTVYYAATHNTALVRHAAGGQNNAPVVPFSPKWTYPFLNGGDPNQGSLFLSVLFILRDHGVVNIQDLPYSGDPSVAANYAAWPTDPTLWRSALHNRIAGVGRFTDLDTPEGLKRLKTWLANGYLATYGTHIDGWKGHLVLSQSDPSLGQTGNACAGQPVCYEDTLMFDDNGKQVADGHAMTIVGYNDDIWIDLNGDGKVEPEEKGAFKIVNSWGPGWPRDSDGGFAWVSYDALREHSVDPAIDQPNRVPCFFFKEAYYLMPQAEYTPKLLAQFTVSNLHRNEIDVRLGVSTTALKAPAKVWRPSLITITDLDEEVNKADEQSHDESDWTSAMGGNLAFDAGDKEVPGTFVFDLDDLVTSFTDPLPGNQYRFYLIVTDLKKDNPTTVSDFQITDGNGKMLAQAKGLPLQVDNNSIAIPLDCPSSPAPAPAPPPQP
jgi:hypothetical protein